MGRIRYFFFYILCGLAAAASQTLVNPGSAVPMVGASGAISGVMGAYVVLYPKVRVHMLVILGIFITRIVVPAYLMLGYWFLLQLVGGGLASRRRRRRLLGPCRWVRHRRGADLDLP